MTEHTDQTATQPDAIPTRIQLDDFIEAVSRGVARALVAQEEVSGYAFSTKSTRPAGTIFGGPPILIGIIYNPPTFPGSLGSPEGSTATNVRQ